MGGQGQGARRDRSREGREREGSVPGSFSQILAQGWNALFIIHIDLLVLQLDDIFDWYISENQTMSHTVESCPLTKLNGGLSRLHSADEDAVSWLTSCL